MAATQFRLDNLIAIVDKNGQQLDGFTSEVMPVHDIEKVFQGFGWNTVVINGHDVEEMRQAVGRKAKGMPTAIIAETIKGKGLPSIEGKTGWHHARITEEQYTELKNELEVAR